MALVCIVGGSTYATDIKPDDFARTGVAELAKLAGKNDTDNAQSLASGVREFLSEYTDVYTAARLILASNWIEATPEQRDRFVVAYNEYVARLLVDFVPEVDFQSVKIDAFNGDPRETPILIKATFRTRDYQTVHFVLVIHEREGRWLIFDVIAEGISYVKLYRQQFNGLEEAIRYFEEKSTF
jgi:phospholipid transport system substrate-binding protein